MKRWIRLISSALVTVVLASVLTFFLGAWMRKEHAYWWYAPSVDSTEDSDVAEAFIINGSAVYITNDGSVYQKTLSGEEKELYSTQEETDDEDSPTEIILSDGGYTIEREIIRDHEGNWLDMVYKCTGPDGNTFEFDGNDMLSFVLNGEGYYAANGLIWKIPLKPEGAAQFVSSPLSGDIIAIAKAGEDILCVAERDHDTLTAAWLLKADGTLVQLTEYAEPRVKFISECKIVVDGDTFMYYSTKDTEVVFGTLPD